ncbi:MAG: PAS domain-containing sensor histidine kinase [Bacteroidales bacterium]|nr:PAS domain-containing sensor histidine kinase [Bacteroidales bacterium]
MTDNSFDIISILANDGTIKFESNAIKRILGYESTERIGESVFKYVHPEDLEYVVNEFSTRDNNVKIVEFRLLHKNGSWRWFEAIGQDFTTDPQISGIIVNSRDITERKEAEKQKNYLSAIIENTENICVIKDLDLKVIATNESFVKATGKASIKDLIGKTDAEIFETTPEEEPIKGYMTDEKNAQKLKKGEKILREEIVIYPDKSIKTLLTTKFPIYNDSNQLIATANVSTDITKLKDAEQKIIKQNQELQQLNEDKNRFMRILGHDLRSPFNSLLGFSNLLNKNLDKYDRTKIKIMITSINEVAQNTYNLLNDLLLWSKSQSGQLPFEPNNEQIESIFEETKKELIYLAQQKNIELKYFESEKMVLYIDKNMFKTIFRNLISNAIKFSYKNSVVDVKCEKNKQHIIIKFSDKGVGIKKEDVNKLWNRAKPFSTQGTENEQGTGLGLLLVKEFVEKHNGKIWVESEYGNGSDFKISIPITN